MPRLAVGVSGKGTNLDAILHAKLPVRLVFADRPCEAIERVKKKLPTIIVDRREYGAPFDRRAHTLATRDALSREGINYIALAGYQTVFDEAMFEIFGGRMLNIHPSLLPSFPGAHAVRDALAYGVKVTGCTAHEVDAGIDTGRIHAQVTVPVLTGDTEESLHRRIQPREHGMYPEVIRKFIAGKFDFDDRTNV